MLHGFIRQHSFASVVTSGPDGPVVSHVPVLLLPERGRYGTLQFHLAKQNGQWRELAGGARALVMFHGPHAYVSPTWYESAVAVPTWNYVAVHAYGQPRQLDDAGLAGHLRHLATAYEPPPPAGWSTDRMPPDVFRKMQQSIVGFEIEITRMEGKWKLGQNRSPEDVRGAIRGLRESGKIEAMTVADLMSATANANGDR